MSECSAHLLGWRLVNKFQILIGNGLRVKCELRCENVKLEMGDYQLKSHMFAIEMGTCDIVLGAKWLRPLGPVTMDFKELYMSFTQDSQIHTLIKIQVGSSKIFSSHRMEKLLKKGHSGIIAQFYAIQGVEDPTLEIH